MEEEVATSEAVETAAPVETTEAPVTETVTEQPQQPEGKPAGFDRVEFTPEQQERVNRLYGNMKGYEKNWREQQEVNARLVAQINELVNNQQQIVTHIQTADYADAEQRLAAQREEAWNKGDLKAFNAANDQLMEIKIKKTTAAQPKPQEQQQPREIQRRSIEGSQVVNGALERGDIQNTDAAFANSWMAETDASGNLLRPWVNASDPRNLKAAKITEGVLNDPDFMNRPLRDKLKEVDRLMGVQTQTQAPAQNVLGAGNLTRGRQNNNIKLDPKIEQIAVRLKVAGNDPKFTAQDHINAWAKAQQKYGRGR